MNRPQAKPANAGLLGFYLFDFPAGPRWLYRLNQGTHVTLGLVLVPIVLIAEWHVGDSVGSGDLESVDKSAQVAPARWSSETFMALALMLEGFTLFVFMASDLLLFYIFF